MAEGEIFSFLFAKGGQFHSEINLKYTYTCDKTEKLKSQGDKFMGVRNREKKIQDSINSTLKYKVHMFTQKMHRTDSGTR